MILAAIVTTTLLSGMHLERDLGPADQHTYTLELSAGGGVVAEADQNGVDLVVDVIDPDGNKLKTIDSPNGAFGPEPIDITALRGGVYTFVVHTLHDDAKPGKYVMRVDAVLDPAANAQRLAKSRYGNSGLYALWLEAQTDPHAVENFVASRKGKGPMVEAIPNDSVNLRVTYFFYGDEFTEAVRENGGPHAATGGMLMTRFLETPLFYASEIVPNDARYTYGFAWIETQSVGAATVSEDHFGNDPLNPNVFNGSSVMAMPNAPAQTYTTARDDVPKGTLTAAKLDSAAMKESRDFSVYTPAGYDGKTDNDLLIAFDAGIYGAGSAADTLIPTPTILDNLIAAKRIAPTIAVLVRNPNRTRDLGMNPSFADFIANELVPWVRKHYRIADGPQHVVVAGSSRGGFAAAFCAFQHPEAIGNVLSQSGSFWIVKDYNGPPRYPFSERSGDLIAAFQSSKRLPIRFYIEIGRFDNGIAMLPMNRELRDILITKGYDVTYNEFDSGHDYLWWRGSFADGLIALLGR